MARLELVSRFIEGSGSAADRQEGGDVDGELEGAAAGVGWEGDRAEMSFEAGGEGVGTGGFHQAEADEVPLGVDPEVLLIPLPGHSAGHTGVAVRDGEGWMLHCGDAYFNRSEMGTPPVAPKGIAAFERVIAADNKARMHNQERLRELAADHGDEVRLFCAHDHVELEREQGSPPA